MEYLRNFYQDTMDQMRQAPDWFRDLPSKMREDPESTLALSSGILQAFVCLLCILDAVKFGRNQKSSPALTMFTHALLVAACAALTITREFYDFEIHRILRNRKYFGK